MSEPLSTPLTRHPFSRPRISQAAIDEVITTLRSGWITSTPKVIGLEGVPRYVGATHAVAFSSATAGIDGSDGVARLASGRRSDHSEHHLGEIGPNMVELHGGTSVFAGIDPTTLQLDPRSVARLIRSAHARSCRCISPARRVMSPRCAGFVQPVVVIEDAAHAIRHAQRGRHVGADAELAVFSCPIRLRT